MTGARPEVTGAKRVVVKVGSSSISGANSGQIAPLVDALAASHGRGTQVVLVSSGAIATGMPYLELDARPNDLATQQAAAAVGQSRLIFRYQESLDRYDIVAGQVLLTAGDLEHATPRSNAQRAIERMLGLHILPIVNENDTVATHEIRFGDNDRLAALVSELLQADLLVLLSDVDALYTRPPHLSGARRIDRVAWEDDLAGRRARRHRLGRRRNRGSGHEDRGRETRRRIRNRRALRLDHQRGRRPQRSPHRDLVRPRPLRFLVVAPAATWAPPIQRGRRGWMGGVDLGAAVNSRHA